MSQLNQALDEIREDEGQSQQKKLFDEEEAEENNRKYHKKLRHVDSVASIDLTEIHVITILN
jgi:hypothetical protein